jgi:hypothetical protein
VSAFDAEAVDAEAACDEVFSESFVFTPFAKSADRTAPDAPDGTRASVTLNATIFEPEAKPQTPNAWDVRQHLRPGVETGEPRIEISVNEVTRQSTALGTPFLVQPGDQFARASGGQKYRASAVFVTATGLVRVKINRIG